MQTRRRGLQPWTNNALAYFFDGLNERPVGVMAPQIVMENRAEKMLVAFEPHNDGGRLVLVNPEDSS